MRRMLEVIWFASIVLAIMLVFVILGALYADWLRWFSGALVVTSGISAIGFAVAWVERRSYNEGYEDGMERVLKQKESQLP